MWTRHCYITALSIGYVTKMKVRVWSWSSSKWEHLGRRLCVDAKHCTGTGNSKHSSWWFVTPTFSSKLDQAVNEHGTDFLWWTEPCCSHLKQWHIEVVSSSLPSVSAHPIIKQLKQFQVSHKHLPQGITFSPVSAGLSSTSSFLMIISIFWMVALQDFIWNHSVPSKGERETLYSIQTQEEAVLKPSAARNTNRCLSQYLTR